MSPPGKGRIEEGFPSEPFANAASRSDSELFRCFNGRDWEGVLACVAPVMVFDERRRLVRNTCDRDVWLEQFRFLFDVPKSRFTSHLRATRGERLALNFHRFEGEVAEGGGPLAMEDHLALHEVDADGRIVGLVLFDLEDEVAAHAELDGRFEAGVGAAVAWRPRYRRAIEARDWEAFAAATAPDFAFRDHRLLGWGTSVRDVPTFVRVMQSAFDLAPDARYRDDHVRLCERGHLAQATLLGTREGGAFESPMLRVTEVDESGRIRGFDTYDLEHLDRARARFAELAALPAAVGRFENAASRAWREVIAAWRQRDLERFAALQPSPLRYRDHRRLFQLDLDREGFLESTRPLLTMRSASAELELLATRGERLALMRFTLELEDEEVGPSAIDSLLLIETDAQSAIAAYDRYEPDDLDAAYAELDAHWESGEGAAHPTHAVVMRTFAQAVSKRAWDAVAALCAATIIEYDHRGLAVLGRTRGAEAWVQNFRALVDLAPGTVYRVDHFRSAAGGFLCVGTWHGLREGGPYEIPLTAVLELDPQDRLMRADIYDDEQHDEALGRFAELSVPATPQPFANAATASAAPVIRSLIAHDWDGVRQLFAEDFRMSDRRRVVQLELDRDQYVAFTREVAEGRTVRNRWELVATRGDRLAVTRAFYEFTDADVGPSEIAFLLLMEVDERGRIVANVRWDVDDLDAAYVELDARWARGEAVVHPAASKWLADYLCFFAARDWSAMAALFAPDVLGENHRLVGWGTRTGPSGIVSTLQAQIDLAPDTRERVDHVRTCAGALLFEYAWHGTRDGGAFENLWIVLVEVDADGRARRADVWDPEQLEQAWARFDEIRASAARDPRAALVKPNAANAAMDRWQAAYKAGFDTGDWDAMRGLCAPGFTFEDRRRLALLSGDRELMVASARERVAMGARPERRVLGTAGDRVALEAMLWSGGPADGRFEIEYVGVSEVGESGLFTGMVLFDLDDARKAQREAWARWAAIDPAVGAGTAMYGAVLDAANDRDLARYRTLFTNELVIEDHRHGIRIDGLDAYAEQVALLWQHAPDSRLDGGWSWPAFARHGAVTVTRRSGAFADEFLWLFTLDEERIARIEVFALDAVDAAAARLDELRAAHSP